MIRLFATDMDGTFLRDDKTYDRARFAAVHAKMQAQGIQWVVASGNQYYQLRSFFEDYPDTLYVAENGAYIGTATETLSVHAFSQAAVDAIIANLLALPQVAFLACGAQAAYAVPSTDAVFVADARRYYHHLDIVADYSQMNDRILKFGLSCPADETDALLAYFQATLGDWAVATSSGRGDIDLIQPGQHKAAGLAEVGRLLDVPLSAMGAFGDGGNDLEMIRSVGLGVAMANAQPDVLAAADAVTTSNEAQGVLAFLETHLAGN
ncbi:Cof-type HAD-IIB family hydrolase [Lacticaseibacillus daqingensis]|uniref:Cof-type HAD-IIB family hydrolase n=1 Tax=Lacticaseibacillus daqingensis TaxID=2486014 RepID=UPI000F77BF9E|nr:Cof-type HAD-IIB family hydrolase [Lacticaseibacillus daqingensis]